MEQYATVKEFFSWKGNLGFLSNSHADNIFGNLMLDLMLVKYTQTSRVEHP